MALWGKFFRRMPCKSPFSNSFFQIQRFAKLTWTPAVFPPFPHFCQCWEPNWAPTQSSTLICGEGVHLGFQNVVFLKNHPKRGGGCSFRYAKRCLFWALWVLWCFLDIGIAKPFRKRYFWLLLCLRVIEGGVLACGVATLRASRLLIHGLTSLVPKMAPQSSEWTRIFRWRPRAPSEMGHSGQL